MNQLTRVQFIWSIADLLRGEYKQADYGKVILPLTVLRRLDSVLAPIKPELLAEYEKRKDKYTDFLPFVRTKWNFEFYNISPFDFEKLLADPNNLAANLRAYVNGFSERAREVIERFKFEEQIQKLDENNLLFQVMSRFAATDLHPKSVSNDEMGYVYEELIRRFSELSNETAGEHFTPREVIRLMVNLLFVGDDEQLVKRGTVRTLYDPACGTGGMLSISEEHVHEMNPDATLKVFGQELNDESWAICNSDMMIKGQESDNIKRGNSFTQDGLPDAQFDYMLSNPPFGVEWKKIEKEIRDEYEREGAKGRFGAGLPRINDGSLLFLQHMLSKMKTPAKGGSRLAIVFNGSPLFTGSAGSGESEIRRWIIENDWLEGIVALPDQLFYNTGISTYFWVLSNRKSHERKGKVQLVNGASFFQKMKKSLGSKRNEVSRKQIDELTRLYGEFREGNFCKIFENEDFGYRRITVERPLRLNFIVNEERIGIASASTAFLNLGKSRKKGALAQAEIEDGLRLQALILAVLEGLKSEKIYLDRKDFEKVFDAAFKQAKVKLPVPLRKALLAALSEHDDSAEICRDGKGNVQSDSELRDFENVPLKEDVEAYFAREIAPHVPDAWIAPDKTKVGYEIPLTRHFYQYAPLRSLTEIESELLELEEKIQARLREGLA